MSVLLDANILLYAADESCHQHRAARDWMETALNGAARVAFPWESIGAFMRISTSPRATMAPLSADRAWGVVSAWLDTEPAWIPHPSRRTLQIFGDLVTRLHVTANLISDAMLASVAIEHGLAVCTADSDFTRFPVRVVNPVATQANRP